MLVILIHELSEAVFFSEPLRVFGVLCFVEAEGVRVGVPVMFFEVDSIFPEGEVLLVEREVLLLHPMVDDCEKVEGFLHYVRLLNLLSMRILT